MAPALGYLYEDCKVSLYYYKKNSQTSSLSGQNEENHVAEASDITSSSEILCEQNSSSDEKNTPVQVRRGRPSSSTVTELMKSGLNSDSKYKCKYCGRSFPRAKSLQTHLRIHDGLKPFKCTFPGCSKTFVQSGQRKTHLRLHAGDKPFLCSFQGCNARYTHPNRHCKGHPTAELKRVEMQLSDISVHYEDHEQSEWVKRYYEDRFPISAETLSSSDMDDSTADRMSPKPHSSLDSSPLKAVVCNNVPSKNLREQSNFNSVAHVQKRLNYLNDSSDKENLTLHEGSNALVIVENPYFITGNHPKRQRVIKTYSDTSAPNNGFHNVDAFNKASIEREQNGIPYVEDYNSDPDPETLEHAKALLSFWLHVNGQMPLANNPTVL